MPPFDIKKAWAALIERTEHPLAPIIVQEAYTNTDRLGRMLGSSPNTDKNKARAYMEKLLSNWTDEELNRICSEPEFVAALASMLCDSIKSYTRETTLDSI
jgi:hypothetical protein